jgi:hypothetical protein
METVRSSTHKHTYRRRVTLGAGVAYALIIGLVSLPAPLQLSQRLLGHSVDTWIFYWNDWWLERAIDEGHNWLSTPYLFYPQGGNLVTHSNAFLNSSLALLLRPLLGPVASYNLVLLCGLWISAIGMFLLVREITHRSSAALLGGFVFALTPYHLTQALAHGNLGSIHWWPFYALFLHRALHQRQRTNILCAGLFAALTLWSGLHLALLLAIWTAIYASWHLLQIQKTDSRAEHEHPYLRTVGIVALVGIITFILGAPVLLPVVRGWRQMSDAATTFDEGMRSQTDLLAYWVPPSYHSLVGPHVQPFYSNFENNATHMPYLGYAVLGLALTSLLSRQKEAKFWLFSAGVWMMLAAGSAPRLNGTLYTDIPLPYRLVEHLFPISAIRVPDRFNLLTVFSLAVSAGLGTAQLEKRRSWLLIPLILLVIVEYLCIPIPMLDLLPGSPFLTLMAQEPPTHAVVDYPMGYTASKRWLYYQTLHGKPLVEGHISRYTFQNYAFIASQPVLRAFYQVAEKPHYLSSSDALSGEALPISALGPALHSLETSGVRYILLHKPFLDAALQDHFRRTLPIIVPIYEDATLAVYDTARPLPVYYDGLPVRLTPDVILAQFDIQRNDTQWQLQVTSIPLVRQNSPLDCQIQLINEARDVLTLPITLFETMPGTNAAWEKRVLEITTVTTTLPQTAPSLASGPHRWTLTCPGGTTYTAPETLEVFADGHVTYLRRWVNVRYDATIELQGYRWRTAGPELQVTLRWKVLGNPTTSYKVFVHLLNVEGAIMAQSDAIPCNWQCPTAQWQAGDVISDQATIPLGTLPPGEYGIAAGLYTEDTLERLPVRGPDGERYPNDYFILPDAFTISE